MNEKFTVFISWSKEPAGKIAKELHTFLKNVIITENIFFFLSSKTECGINPGERGRNIIDENLEKSNYGISILTNSNIGEPWLLYEAGALAKKLKSNLSIILFGRDNKKIEPPLQVFQYILFTKEGITELILNIIKTYQNIEYMKPEHITGYKQLIDMNWNNFKKNMDDILSDINNIDNISNHIPELMMNEKAYSEVLSKRETHLQKLISILREDRSKRIIFFGGISTILRKESSLDTLSIWLINNPHSKLFICYENEIVAKKRAYDIKNEETIKRKVNHFREMKNNLLNRIGKDYQENIFFIEISELSSIYVTIHNSIVYFTPVLDKRSSVTFTFKLNNSDLSLDILDYLPSRIDCSLIENKIFLEELDSIKFENISSIKRNIL